MKVLKTVALSAILAGASLGMASTANAGCPVGGCGYVKYGYGHCNSCARGCNTCAPKCNPCRTCRPSCCRAPCVRKCAPTCAPKCNPCGVKLFSCCAPKCNTCNTCSTCRAYVPGKYVSVGCRTVYVPGHYVYRGF